MIVPEMKRPELYVKQILEMGREIKELKEEILFLHKSIRHERKARGSLIAKYRQQEKLMIRMREHIKQQEVNP